MVLRASGKANWSSVKISDNMRPWVLTEPWVLLTFCMPKAPGASLMDPSVHFTHKVTKSDRTLLSLCGSMLRAFEGLSSEGSPEQPGDIQILCAFHLLKKASNSLDDLVQTPWYFKWRDLDVDTLINYGLQLTTELFCDICLNLKIFNVWPGTDYN